MKAYKIRQISLIAVLLSAVESSPTPVPAPQNPAEPKIIGAMKDVMWGGRLSAQFDSDTLAGKGHLYGLGPMEFLAGEILILDGKAYKAQVLGDTSIKVTETSRVRAPFFGYANIGKWGAFPLPDSVATSPIRSFPGRCHETTLASILLQDQRGRG